VTGGWSGSKSSVGATGLFVLRSVQIRRVLGAVEVEVIHGGFIFALHIFGCAKVLNPSIRLIRDGFQNILFQPEKKV
jgi:hypothetical protein